MLPCIVSQYSIAKKLPDDSGCWVQECMQTAVASHKPDAALKFLSVLAGLPSPVCSTFVQPVNTNTAPAVFSHACTHSHGQP